MLLDISRYTYQALMLLNISMHTYYQAPIDLYIYNYITTYLNTIRASPSI